MGRDSKTPHRPAGERVSWCLGTSLLRLPPGDGSPSLTLLSLLLSFIFCLTSFKREWAAFLGAWCPLPAFRSCFVEVDQRPNDLLMNLWGRKLSPLRVVHSSTGLLSKRCPGIGFLLRADWEIGLNTIMPKGRWSPPNKNM